MYDVEHKVGDIVRLVQCRGHVPVADAGKLVTVRAISSEYFGCTTKKVCMVRVDNGDPANDDLHTNGMTYAAWLPMKTLVVAFEDESHRLKEAQRLRTKASQMLALAQALEGKKWLRAR